MSATTLTPDEVRALVDAGYAYTAEYADDAAFAESARRVGKALSKLETALALHEERKLEALQERALG